MPTDLWVPVIPFHQFSGGQSQSDQLLLFAAPAKALYNWAGIPRKGWHIRMLYQRWVTPQRARELKDFWDRAAMPKRGNGEDYILGPTAITVAIQDEIRVEDGKVLLSYTPPIDFAEDPVNNLGRLATLVLPRVEHRLVEPQQRLLQSFASDPLSDLPDIEHDYVLEFALQLVQMAADPGWFVAENGIGTDDVRELVGALEALCRPALVVDGQHRLRGAADSDADVSLAVVAMPHSSWDEQIYQFIVINEKAQKVDSGLFTDIFGSSLTQQEQRGIRDRLARARVDVEARIASVIANRDKRSPFFGMVRVPIGSSQSAAPTAYISDTTIRLLIDGGGRSSRGWRSDDEFYEAVIKPAFPVRADWESWTNGAWIDYWFAFWHTVADYYNVQAAQAGSAGTLWNATALTNLTKAATLRTLQRLFIDKTISQVNKIEEMRGILTEALDAEAAEAAIARKRAAEALPALEAFPEFIVSRFLKHIPVRIFTAPWVGSLDDSEGLSNLYAELEEAYDRSKSGKVYKIGNKDIFAIQSAADAVD